MKLPTYYSESEISPEGVPRYLVATPYWGALDQEHQDCVLALRRQYPALQKQCYRVNGCAYIDIGRATAAQAALDGGFDGLFFIDHDILFNPADVVGLMRQAVEQQTVCFALYSMRASGKRMIGCFAEGTKEADCFADGKLYPGRDGGLGFAAIPRAVLERVGRDMIEVETGFSKVKPMFALRSGTPDWTELYDAMVKRGLLPPEMKGIGSTREAVREIVKEQSGGWYSGEDISFFSRVRSAGFLPLVDTRPRIVHKGSYRYMLEDVQVVVPRAESLTLKLVELDDPDDPQHLLAAAAAQFEGAVGPLTVKHPQQAAE